MHGPRDVDELRERLATALGWSAYNQLVESVPRTQSLGRLRFWQEQLLLQAGPDGSAISTLGEFLRVFGGSSLQPVPSEPWTRERLLQSIEQWPFGGFPLDQTPPEWMAAAWEVDSVRESLSYALSRTVGKCGELAYEAAYLHYLSLAIPVERQVELFLYIRERSGREVEFRPGFEEAFPECVPALPPPQFTAQELDERRMIVEEYSRESIPLLGDRDQGYEEIPF